MSGPGVDDGFFDGVFDGVDGPRPLPAALRAELEGLLAGAGETGVVAAMASGLDAPAAVPVDLRDRLEASLVGAAGGGALPGQLQRRLLRVLPGGGSGGRRWRGLRPEAMLVRVAAVAAAVLLVSGLAVAASQRGKDDDRPLGGTVAAPPPPTSAVPPATTVAPAAEPTTTVPAPPRSKPAPPAPVLVAYRSCADLLEQTKQQVLAVVGPYGLGGEPVAMGTVASGGSASAATGAPAAASGTSSGGETSGGESSSEARPEVLASGGPADPFSSTNVQEDGVDEPDVVKTDGRRIVTISGRTLRVLSRDRESGGLALAGSFELPADAYGSELLLAGNRLVVLSNSELEREVPIAASGPSRFGTAPMHEGPSWSAVRVIDLSDPAAMRLVSTLYLEGSYRTARFTGGRVRVVVKSTGLGPVFEYPKDGSEEAKAAALARNREIVANSTVEDWTPRYVLVDGNDQAAARSGRLCACDDVLRPKEFGGVGTVSVLTIDPANPVPGEGDGEQGAAVQGSADTVYASTSNLFVTSHAFTQPRAGAPEAIGETAIHRFEIRGTEPARYKGSGRVRGTPLNQWALSERGGHLRVATTETRPTGKVWPAPQIDTESFVTTLAVHDDRLTQAGQLGGLGHEGERIHGVRFFDTLAYVVTFRQTDPVYVIDLSQPSAPKLRGELQVTGYSAYLHPLESGYLLGVGRDWVEEAGGRQAQMSTFDVRDSAKPTLVDRHRLGPNSSTIVEHDHRAFLYWPATRLAVLPYEQHTQESNGRTVSTWGVAAVNVGGDYKLSELGRLTHAGREHRRELATNIGRSIVIGGALYTLSDAGVLANDLGTLVERQWLAY